MENIVFMKNLAFIKNNTIHPASADRSEGWCARQKPIKACSKPSSSVLAKIALKVSITRFVFEAFYLWPSSNSQ